MYYESINNRLIYLLFSKTLSSPVSFELLLFYKSFLVLLLMSESVRPTEVFDPQEVSSKVKTDSKRENFVGVDDPFSLDCQPPVISTNDYLT